MEQIQNLKRHSGGVSWLLLFRLSYILGEQYHGGQKTVHAGIPWVQSRQRKPAILVR